MKNMLSAALREVRGPLNQLLVNFEGEDGETWLSETKKFLRKEATWDMVKKKPTTKMSTRKKGLFETALIEAIPDDLPLEIANEWLNDPDRLKKILRAILMPKVKGNEYLELLTDYKDLSIDAVDGTQRIVPTWGRTREIKDDHGVLKKDYYVTRATGITPLDMYEFKKRDASAIELIESVCSDLSSACFTEAQIMNFAQKYLATGEIEKGINLILESNGTYGTVAMIPMQSHIFFVIRPFDKATFHSYLEGENSLILPSNIF